jgi:hypothetical protein
VVNPLTSGFDWEPNAAARFTDTLHHYRARIAAVLFGHFHTADTRAHLHNRDMPPMLIAPALAPTFHTVPGVRRLSFTPGSTSTSPPHLADFQDLRIRTLAGATSWQWLPRFTETHQVPSASADSIRHAISTLLRDDAKLARTLSERCGGIQRARDTVAQLRCYLGDAAHSVAAFQACLELLPRAQEE